ncbi:MAG: hypothetical protein PHW63_10575 [Alphaproteobacteria bacterium]|nr:hypothetical protein [Alphaproteobacteria bacterium]
MNQHEMREVFRAIGKDLTNDREMGTFRQPEAAEVSWLANEPQTDEEIAENLYERLSSVGISMTFNQSDVDAVDIMGAYMARKRATSGSDAL